MLRLQAFFWKIHFLRQKLLCNTKFYIWVLNYRLFQFLHLAQKFTITMFDSFDCSINNRKYVAMKLEMYFPGINLFFFSKSRIIFFDETLFHRKFSELRNSKRRNWFRYDRLSWTPNDYVQNYFNLDVNFQKKNISHISQQENRPEYVLTKLNIYNRIWLKLGRFVLEGG